MRPLASRVTVERQAEAVQEGDAAESRMGGRCGSVPRDSCRSAQQLLDLVKNRGLPLVGKLSPWPLANLMEITPRSCRAFRPRSAKVRGPCLFDEFEMAMDEIPMPGRRFSVPRPNWSQELVGIPGERSFLTVRVKRIPTDCEKGFTVSPKRTRQSPA
jgi:hypothetical protein